MKERKPKNVFVEGPIEADFIAKSIAAHQEKTDIGAHSIFLGQVRADLIQGRKVRGIEYTTYRELAEPVFHEIREAAFERFPLSCLHIYHALGMVAAGQISLFVFCSSAHRKAATEACTFLVEEIKKKAPIWGREIFEDDSYQWKENTPHNHPTTHD